MSQTCRSVLSIAKRSEFSAGKYNMVLTSAAYKGWRFKDEGLPADLLKRRIAVKNTDGSLKLLLKDYPYAQDGLLIWESIHTWVSEYLKVSCQLSDWHHS